MYAWTSLGNVPAQVPTGLGRFNYDPQLFEPLAFHDVRPISASQVPNSARYRSGKDVSLHQRCLHWLFGIQYVLSNVLFLGTPVKPTRSCKLIYFRCCLQAAHKMHISHFHRDDHHRTTIHRTKGLHAFPVYAEDSEKALQAMPLSFQSMSWSFWIPCMPLYYSSDCTMPP